VLNTAKVKPGSSVAVFGAGGVGLSILMGAKLAGASRLIVVDRVQDKLDIATAFGATDVLLPGPTVPETIRGMTGGRGADYVFEAIGLPAVQEQCLDCVRPGGLIVLAGISPMGSGTNFPGAVLARQDAGGDRGARRNCF
jgi:S-(hydroxymethyl)glutathione dehydrogenase/alcohol dehydrogenase